MTSESIAFTWVAFIASGDEHVLRSVSRHQDRRLNEYYINTVIPVTGNPPPELAPGWGLVRVESEMPIQFLGEKLSGAKAPVITFRGVTQHLHYTSLAQRQELDARSRAELSPSAETTAVMIPIRKSQGWWQLAQDDRQAHFQSIAKHPGHTATGLRYVDRVFRKLYHSRYLDPPPPYDFLTYFEFHDAHADAFKELLRELRDKEHNPEWAYVELEYEIWMTKHG